ncbi:iron ABC transporter permease [Nonomuraea gerenzanensis]|uniref:Ferric hydroxamate ABC transporter (TC 3.A.1.14.3), permease component FhuB n=1 Tax=Nonomuraea gerenzanensis TaxID=93944 RepID=A0A1M4E5G8_9ACTN|nr:iron ABC transporter permease [Nonomuraea gerenzanensis]UBU16219.1 iron ABC transporter permease [Nonomuraea gerenzanensis]SBO94033.1 Ferric hydroxamate ABC transporter (TC 3.A.1.14.3), permease component FhuB [Nonomuraea gerenzanensis]
MSTDVLTPAPPTTPLRRLGTAGVFLLALAATVLVAAVHVTQGTSSIGALDLLALPFGGDSGNADEAARVLLASRLPRLLAGVCVGVALGVAGALLQSVARNAMAAPDTLAVSSGAYLAVATAAAFGLALPVPVSGGLALVGGLCAAALVLALSAGGRTGTTRLILAGTATSLALSSLTNLVMILFEQETTGLFAWGSGSLVQSDLDAVSQLGPLIAIALAAAVVAGPRLDILGLGDDTATVLGVNVRRLRLWLTLLAVLLAAAAVTIAGPIGFVGLCAPVVVRLLPRSIPGLHRHRMLLPLSGVAGVLIMLGSDILLRAVLGAQAGVEVPPGVVTTVIGAAVMIWLARRYRDAGPTRKPPAVRTGGARSRAAFLTVVGLCAVLVAGAVVLGLLGGDRWLLTGDVFNWLQGRSGRALTYVLDQRWPRVAAALLAGAALAVAGAAVQAVCRNPLAEPGVLGVTTGAGVGAIALITLAPTAGIWSMSAAAGMGALIAFSVVYGLAWRGGLSSDRLVLIGVALQNACTAVTVLIIVLSDPWNTAKALTWLSGSTYGRVPEQLIPVVLALLIVTPLLVWLRRDLDLLALDEDTPRILGVPLEPVRLGALAGAVLLTSTAVSAVGVVAFVGLVAPHAARALVGAHHARVLPVAALLGALLVSLADTLGRTVIAPAQVPAGLVTALIGTPYFVYLLWRARA